MRRSLLGKKLRHQLSCLRRLLSRRAVAGAVNLAIRERRQLRAEFDGKRFWTRSMNRKKPRISFAVCVQSQGYDDLQVRKIYRILPDAKAAEVGCLRVIDDSGEDYLYPAARFLILELPTAAREQLLAVTRANAA